MSRTPQQLEVAISRLEVMRHRAVMCSSMPSDGSLLPLLNASAEVAAIDVALESLREQLREVAS